MDSEAQTTRFSAVERITAAAEQAGAARREKVIKTIDRVLGAPEAAGMAVRIAGETLNDLKDRAENAFAETAMNLAERADNAWARFTNRVTETRNEAVAKATEIKNKAIKVGLETGLSIENRVVKICELPADLTEKVAGGYKAKAESSQSKLMSEAVKMATAEASLSVEQAAIIQRILETQAAQREKMSAEHELKSARMQNKIEAANTKAVELKAAAGNVRAGVEKRRVFESLLAKFNA